MVSTDIADAGFGTPGVDFLACRNIRDGCRSIITNPPYGEAALDAGQPRSSKAMLEFLRHALALTATAHGQLALLVRLTSPTAAVVVSAAGWGIAHSTAAPGWGLVIWWPFVIFSTLFLTWRKRSTLAAIGMATAAHAAHNLLPSLLLVSGLEG